MRGSPDDEVVVDLVVGAGVAIGDQLEGDRVAAVEEVGGSETTREKKVNQSQTQSPVRTLLVVEL